MVPTKLTLSNFTSYGTDVPFLDFTKFHMAAISGPNGAGKSSLLDSLTWCLWGTSRLGDSSDQLIRLGQHQMFVEVTFSLDNHSYTVKRARVLKGVTGTSSLEFFSGFASSPQAHNLTEGTIKATQQKIIDTIHLSYETFTNSAFLRQGHADEFTTKGPSDRKRILADILGLSHYDLLEEKAKEKVKEAQTKLQLLEYKLLEIEAELSQKEERAKRLSEAEEEAQRLTEELVEADKLIRAIEKERELINTRYQASLEKQQKLEAAQKELEELEVQISLKERAKKGYEAILSQREKIEEAHQKKEGLQKQKLALDLKRSELIKIKDEALELERKIQELDRRRESKIKEIEIEIKKIQTENDEKLKKIKELKEKKDICPTCHQPINVEKNKQLAEAANKELEENSQKLKSLEADLKKVQSFELPQQKELDLKHAQIKKLEDEAKDYNQITSDIDELSQSETNYLRLKEADTAVKTHQEAITGLEKIYQSREKQVEEERKALGNLENVEEQLKEVEGRFLAKEATRQELSQKAQSSQAAVGEAKHLVGKVRQLEDLQKEKNAEKSKLQTQKSAFEELAQAFGKKGIQAMIIETAIPEIEEEANRLLDKLSEGGMKVRLDTQKETKAGTTAETLEIIISDEMGERPYEAYSGGEQFRVNFAIRLALSKLLTHRAGAKLQFLVIDEGFGTQDAQGRTRIIEAIEAIKNDFEKIVIITHLDELKDEFPNRIEVTKGAGGSTFEVVGS